MEFKDYKEKQEYYRKLSKTGMLVYQVKKGGKPYNKERYKLEQTIKDYKLKRLFGQPNKEVQ